MSRRSPLLPAGLRPPVLALAVVCAVLAATLGAWYADAESAGRLDSYLEGGARDLVSEAVLPFRVFAALGSPPVVVVIAAALAGYGLAVRRWRVAVLALVAPGVASGVTRAMKHLVERTSDGTLAYPSGHATGAVALLVVLVVLTAVGARHWLLGLGLLGAAMVIAAGVAVSLVGLGYHYATDTVGGAAVAVAVTLAAAVIIDLVGERWLPGHRDEPSDTEQAREELR